MEQMRRQPTKLLNILAWTLVVVAFFVLSSVAIVWANGLKFNPEKRSFEQTSVIAIQSNLPGVTIKLNGKILANSAPAEFKSLAAGNYSVSIEKLGYFPWRQSFNLAAGQVGLINHAHLIAQQPNIQVVKASDYPFSSSNAFDVGLSSQNNELVDGGALVSRFSGDLIQAHRFLDGYVYQIGSQLHLFYSDGPQDYLLYTAKKSTLIPLVFPPISSQFALINGDQALLVSPIVASEPSVNP